MAKLIRLNLGVFAKTRTNQIIMIVFLIFCVSYSGYCVLNQAASVYSEDVDDYVVIQGKDALNENIEDDKSIEGLVSTDRLLKIYDLYIESVDEKGKVKKELYNDIKRYARYYAMFPLCSKLYDSRLSEGEVFLPSEVSRTEVASFYEGIQDGRRQFYSNLGYKGSRLEQLEADLLKINTPYTYYPIYGYDNFVNYFPILLSISLVFIIVMTAPIFLAHSQNGELELFSTFKFGRRNFVTAKMLSYNIVSFIMWTIAYCIPIIAIMLNVGSDGLRTSIQFFYVFSASNLNLGQYLILLYCLGLTSVIGMTNLCAFLSLTFETVHFILAIGLTVVAIPIVSSLLSLAHGPINNILNLFLPSNHLYNFESHIVLDKQVGTLLGFVPLCYIYALFNLLLSAVHFYAANRLIERPK